jgi:hypothetical protein
MKTTKIKCILRFLKARIWPKWKKKIAKILLHMVQQVWSNQKYKEGFIIYYLFNIRFHMYVSKLVAKHG